MSSYMFVKVCICVECENYGHLKKNLNLQELLLPMENHGKR